MYPLAGYKNVLENSSGPGKVVEIWESDGVGTV